MSIPKKHHFLPEFFLKQWCDRETGKLFHFHIPYRDKLISEPRYPSQVGFEEFLYSIKDLPVEKAQTVEQIFFSKVDNDGSIALNKLLTQKTLCPNHEKMWINFITTLIARMPADLELFVEILTKTSDAIVPVLSKVSKLSEFSLYENDLQDAEKKLKTKYVNEAAHHLSIFLSNEKFIRRMGSMSWKVVELSKSKHELLTSDRPLHFNVNNQTNLPIITLPVGPKTVFFASENTMHLQQIAEANQSQLVKKINGLTVGSATNSVFGRTESQKKYISKYLGQRKSVSFMENYSEIVSQQVPSIAKGMDKVMGNMIDADK